MTSNYSGLFFRAHGGDSEDFGTIQNENSPRINRVEHGGVENADFPYYPVFTAVPNEGWSSWVATANNDHYSGSHLSYWSYALRFNVTGGEVRPKNTAIRIWERTA